MDNERTKIIEEMMAKATALSQTKKEEDVLEAAQIFLELYNMHLDADDKKEALLYYEDMVGSLMFLNSEFKNGKYFYTMLDKLTNLGIWYSDMGDYERAQIWFEKFFEESGMEIRRHPFGIRGTELTMPKLLEAKGKAVFFYAMLCRRAKRFHECLRIYDIAFSLFKILADKDYKFMMQLLQIQSNIAFVHDEMGNFNMANTYFMHVFEYWLAIEKKEPGTCREQVDGYVETLSKLYDKYNKLEKKKILAKLVEATESKEIKQLTEDLRREEADNSGYPEIRLDLVEQLAEKGVPETQFELGGNYFLGRGVKQDYAKAFEWYTKAAEQGYAPALFNLGDMYFNGAGVEKNIVKAVEYYEKAAEKGLAIAQSNLGAMYFNGYGVKKDYIKAKMWYEKAAEQGDDKALFNLGIMYYEGEGVDKDINKALELFQSAAKKGNKNALNVLKQING